MNKLFICIAAFLFGSIALSKELSSGGSSQSYTAGVSSAGIDADGGHTDNQSMPADGDHGGG